MNFFEKYSIKSKLLILIMGINSITILAGIFILYFVNTKLYKEDLVNDISVKAKFISQNLISPIDFNDKEGANKVLKNLSSFRNIINCRVIDKSGDIFSSYQRDSNTITIIDIKAYNSSYQFINGYFYYNEPIFINNERVGNVTLIVSTDELKAKINNFILAMVVVYALLLIASLILALRLQKFISGPILHLAKTTKAISKNNDYSVQIEIQGSDEISHLFLEFNNMLMVINTKNNEMETTQNELIESEKALKSFIESNPESVCLIDKFGKIIVANTSFIEHFFYSRDLDDQSNIYQKIHKNLTKIVKFSIESAISKMDLVRIEMEDESKIYDLYLQPLFDKNSDVVKLSILAVDITVRKQSEAIIIKKNEELKLAIDKANESDQLKSAFLANMSHEIRTPMNGIIGFSQLLLADDLDNDEKVECVNVIQNSSKQLLSIINDIIDVSKIESGQIIINSNDTIMNDLLKDVYDLLSEEALKKGLNLTYECQLALNDSIIKIDSSKIKQILTNLIMNAIKFTDHGNITFGYKIDHKVVIFYVKDTGIGIASENLGIIFERFRQADGSLSRQYGGTGLGLAICKGFVENMGGRIWAESEIESGSSFYFSIPLQRPTIKSMRTVNTGGSSQLMSNFENKKILVAEDENINFRYLEKILRKSKVEIVHAKNGMEAVTLCRNSQFDLILMDIKMQVMDGVEALNEIKLFNKSVPIIAITAYAFEQDKEKMLDYGFSDYLSKPYTKEQLYDVLKHYI
jgi:PAS domain S-box-containing protein